MQNRTTIIQKSRELMERMDMQPYAFITQHSISNLKRLEGFKHRTLMADDVFPSKQPIPHPSFSLTAGREGRRCRIRKIPVLENVFICITG